MGELAIYNEKKLELGFLSFVKDTSNQVKIRDIKDSYSLALKLTIVTSEAAIHLGIKNTIENHTKKDIKNLLLYRFKNLSLEEVSYAFKLERYGELGEKTQHFQLFNAEYVGTVLEKYIDWKRQIKLDYNIQHALPVPQISEEEKKEIVNSGVIACYNYFSEYGSVETGRLYVYDVLYEKGYLPKDKEFKQKIHKAAIECIQIELELKKPISSQEKKEMAYILKKINTDPKDEIIVRKCKELVLCRFFRELSKDDTKLEEFLNKFSNE